MSIKGGLRQYFRFVADWWHIRNIGEMQYFLDFMVFLCVENMQDVKT